MRGVDLNYLLRITILFAAYFITARLGLSLDAVSGFAALVWAPTGIALAAILILGNRYWPGIALAAFLVNLVTGAPPLVAAGIAVGNTLEALLAAFLLNHFWHFDRSLERTRDILNLVFFAAVLSTLISATIGVSSLLLGGVITASVYWATWATWWVGDMLGALVVTPVILVWTNHKLKIPDRKRLAEGVLLWMLLVLIGTFVFQPRLWQGIQPFTFAYAIFPVLIWISLRFGQLGSTAATFVVAAIAIGGTVIGFSQTPGTSLTQKLFVLQTFIGISAVTFMTMAAVVAEGHQTQKRQQRLIQRAEFLAKQRSRLLALGRAKDEFVSLASHQLRTPATAVKQYVGMLLEGYRGKLSAPQKEFLQRAYDSNEHQLRTINDLLQVAQIDADAIVLHHEECDIAALVYGLVQDQRSNAKERGQRIVVRNKLAGVVNVRADMLRLRMAFDNLLDNACKYSPERTTINVKIVPDKHWVTVSIADHGVGIAEKDIPRLFKKFSRIDNPRSTIVGGTGIGLYLAKRIVAAHKGEIAVSSALGDGSVFTVRLPISKQHRQ